MAEESKSKPPRVAADGDGKTACVKGHPYTDGNFYRGPYEGHGGGRFICIPCQSALVKGQGGARKPMAVAPMVKTAQDFALTMSQLLTDVLEGKVDTTTADSAVRVGGALLRVVELQYRYGFSLSQKINGEAPEE